MSNNPALGEDRRRAGIVLLCASCMTILASILIVPVLVKFRAAFEDVPHVDIWVGLVLAAPALVTGLSAPFFGRFIDRFGRRMPLIVGTVLYGVFGMLPYALDDIRWIAASRFVFGFAEAVVMTSCTALIGDYYEGAERERYLNLQMRFIGVAGTLLFLASGILGEWGWRLPFLLYGGVFLLLPFLFRLTEPSHISRIDSLGMQMTRFRSRRLWPQVLVVLFGMLLVYAAPVQYPFLMARIGLESTTLLGLGSAFGILATVAGTLLWPKLRKRWSAHAVNIVTFAFLSLGLLMLAYAPNFGLSLLALAVHGFGAGMLVPNTMAWTMENIRPWHMGTATGTIYFGLYLGQFLSPFVVNVVAALGAGLVGAFVWLVVSGVVAMGFAALALRRWRSRQARERGYMLRW